MKSRIYEPQKYEESIIYKIVISNDNINTKKQKIIDALNNGANIEDSGGMWNSAPFLACIKNQEYDLARFLIDRGADPWRINSINGNNFISLVPEKSLVFGR